MASIVWCWWLPSAGGADADAGSQCEPFVLRSVTEVYACTDRHQGLHCLNDTVSGADTVLLKDDALMLRYCVVDRRLVMMQLLREK